MKDVISVQDDERKKKSLNKQQKSEAKGWEEEEEGKRKEGAGVNFISKQANKQTNKISLSLVTRHVSETYVK